MEASESKLTRPGRWAIALLTLLYGGAHLGWGARRWGRALYSTSERTCN